MTITVSQISSLVGRFTNSVVNEQANLSCPFVGKGIITKKKIADKIGVVNIKAGELSSAGTLADAGTLPTGDDVQPAQGTYLPVAFYGRMAIPRIAAKLASSLDDGIELVKEEMESCGATLGRILGRAIFAPTLPSILANVSVNDTTFTVASPAGFRQGMAFEVWNGGTAIEGNTEATKLRVTNVSIPVDGSPSTITFTGSGPGAAVAWTTAYTLYLRGTKLNPCVSLADVASTSTIYSMVGTTNEWSGNSDSTTTTMSVTALRRMLTLTKRRRGERPDYIVSNSVNEQRYSDLLINNRRFMNGKMDAVGGAGFDLEGVPWFTDENVDDTDVFYHNQKDVTLHQFQDFQPEIDGGKQTGMNMGAYLVSSTTLTYDVQVLGIFNLRAQRRNGTSRFSALTG